MKDNVTKMMELICPRCTNHHHLLQMLESVVTTRWTPVPGPRMLQSHKHKKDTAAAPFLIKPQVLSLLQQMWRSQNLQLCSWKQILHYPFVGFRIFQQFLSELFFLCLCHCFLQLCQAISLCEELSSSATSLDWRKVIPCWFGFQSNCWWCG